MKFREQYPERLTKGADGIYRWSVEVDPARDHYVRDLTMKIMFFICAGICMMTIIFACMTGDMSMVWIPLLCCGVALVITVLVLRLFRSGDKDRYTVGYEMNETGIRPVRAPAPADEMKTAAESVPGGNRTVRSATTEFRNVRSMSEVPETHMICLSTTTGALQVWIPEDDYDVVCAYIREHMDRKKDPFSR